VVMVAIGLLYSSWKWVDYRHELMQSRLAGASKQKIFEGFLFKLRDYLNTNVSVQEFQLVLGGRKEVDRFWIKEVTGKTWSEIFQKICVGYEACLRCDPPPEQVKNQVRVEISGDVVQSKTSE